MAIQLCPVDTANVHPRNILGSSSSFAPSKGLSRVYTRRTFIASSPRWLITLTSILNVTAKLQAHVGGSRGR